MSFEGIENFGPRPDPVEESRRLMAKALLCIEVARRMLPDAHDATIEMQAADLMHLPQSAIDATLRRQTELGQRLAAAETPPEENIIGKVAVERVSEMARKIQWKDSNEQI